MAKERKVFPDSLSFFPELGQIRCDFLNSVLFFSLPTNFPKLNISSFLRHVHWAETQFRENAHRRKKRKIQICVKVNFLSVCLSDFLPAFLTVTRHKLARQNGPSWAIWKMKLKPWGQVNHYLVCFLQSFSSWEIWALNLKEAKKNIQ